MDVQSRGSQQSTPNVYLRHTPSSQGVPRQVMITGESDEDADIDEHQDNQNVDIISINASFMSRTKITNDKQSRCLPSDEAEVESDEEFENVSDRVGFKSGAIPSN